MERNRKTHLLFLLLALIHVCTVTADTEACPNLTDLTCYNDYNRIITCMWNSTYVPDYTDVCKIEAKKLEPESSMKFGYKTCKLEPDVSKPELKKCSMDIGKDDAFQSFEVWSIDLKCISSKQSLNIVFKPVCSIQLNPPGKPKINFTTVSWSSQVTNQESIEVFESQLQWKQQDQSWSDPFVHIMYKPCGLDCETELYPDQLIQGERYEVRIRVQVAEDPFKSTWSDWGPSTSWVSLVGKTKPPPDVTRSVLGMIIAGAATFALILAVILLKTDKNTWVYKKIRGPPIPNPAISFLKDVNFQNWFTSDSFHSFLKPVEIVTVEITSTVDAVTPCRAETALLEKMKNESSSGSTSSSYSNPSYSQLCPPPPPPPPISSLTAGNLQPCAADTPYGPVGNQRECENAEQNKEEERRKEMEILQLLSKCSKNSESVQVISDYEKVEKLQLERMRLQSLDSGVCSGEEVSQESLEADSINMTDSHDEGPEDKEEQERVNTKEVDFHKLFGGSIGIFGKGSIQVYSDYKQVQKLQPDSPELSSLDSGVSSGGEEQVSQEESLGDVSKTSESMSFLFPPPPSCPVPCSLPSFSKLPLTFPGPGLSPALQPLPNHILERIALLSAPMSVEPSGDGYMPVKQEQV